MEADLSKIPARITANEELAEAEHRKESNKKAEAGKGREAELLMVDEAEATMAEAQMAYEKLGKVQADPQYPDAKGLLQATWKLKDDFRAYDKRLTGS